MVVAGKKGISILTCETACGALRRGLVWLKMSPINSLNDHCGVFHQLEDIETPRWSLSELMGLILSHTKPLHLSCVHLAPFALLAAEVLLQYLCTNFVCSWVGMFSVILLLLLLLCFLDVFFYLFKKFLLLGCDFRW